MLDLLACGALGAFLVWLFFRRPARRRETVIRTGGEPAWVALARTETAIDLRVPDLGSLADQITEALRRGKDPNSELSIAHHAHHLSVVGESFANANGTSRQRIIQETKEGAVVFLVPEPDNPHDPNAIRVFVSKGGAATAQIGYLGRENAAEMLGEVQRGHVAAWFCSKTRARAGTWGVVLFVVRTEVG
jgi:hypothetical protein